ncbi:hypothetical protein FQN57_001864 [Myotisia sp. PD_48]|nr:hypothetical protein FQN57_001864 [Myotisia sp. PD_48]
MRSSNIVPGASVTSPFATLPFACPDTNLEHLIVRLASYRAMVELPSSTMKINYPGPIPAITLAAVLTWIYTLGILIYRLWFSPLSKFPGPKLAAATFWYEFYYDAILRGRYMFQIKKFHEQYGPIVRVSPTELSINDPEYYRVLYSHTNPRDKDYYYMKPFDFPMSAFGTESHKIHRSRRAAMNPFFSRGKVLQQEKSIQELVQKLCERISKFGLSNTVIPLTLGFTCLTTDLITSFVMDRSFGYLDAPNWHPHWGQTLRDASELATVTKQITWILPILKCLPQPFVESLNPGLSLFYTLARRCQERIAEVFISRETIQEIGAVEERKRTLFDQILDSNLSFEEKEPERLAQEVRSAIGAGTETTSNTLSVITFHILSNPNQLRTLQNELRGLEPDLEVALDLCALEKLPYLSSVVLEGLRLSYGVSTRLLRKSPEEPMIYKDYVIPTGVSVGMSSVLMHHHEQIFPESHKFLPERWLDLEERKHLEKYMVSFSSGSRRCIGMNLAKAEIFIAIATLFRRFDFELCNTTRDDIDVHHDLFIPRPKNLKTMGVQVRLKDNNILQEKS